MDQQNGQLCQVRVGVPLFDKADGIKGLYGSFQRPETLFAFLDDAVTKTKISVEEAGYAKKLVAMQHEHSFAIPDNLCSAAAKPAPTSSAAPKEAKPAKPKLLAVNAGQLKDWSEQGVACAGLDAFISGHDGSGVSRYEVVVHPASKQYLVKELGYPSKAVLKLLKSINAEVSEEKPADAKEPYPWFVLLNAKAQKAKRTAEAPSEPTPKKAKKIKKEDENKTDKPAAKKKQKKEAPAIVAPAKGANGVTVVLQPVVARPKPALSSDAVAAKIRARMTGKAPMVH